MSVLVPAALGQREPVLKQVDLPHPYYYREMYLPRLTTGPSSVAWLPDSKSIVYSMQGTLWRQQIDSVAALQLTSGSGYDYQPDCSRDGRWVIYDSYQHDAIELWALDLKSGQTKQLTSGGAVNVEPRFSPDGKRIAFVSTSYHGHFHIFAGDFSSGTLTNVQRLTSETTSDLPRYYYSKFDHEISPVWSPDGQEILFVSNRGHIYGTGGFWRMKAQPGAEAHEIHYEETTWKARPDFSPDGKRMVYASYLGQQWHQIWLMPAEGGDGFPISYGDFDKINPRWSPDGTKIAFISNRGGNTSLYLQSVPGGAQNELVGRETHYLHPMARLRVRIFDEHKHLTGARISVTGDDYRVYAPDNAWMQADDSLFSPEQPFEKHYFASSGEAEMDVPRGRVTVEVMKGFEYEPRKIVQPVGDKTVELDIGMTPLKLPQDTQSSWVSADVHVHMNYGGTYRNTPAHLVTQAAAENLAIIENLIVNKEERIPDISYFSRQPDPASTATQLIFHGQEFHTSYWGHLGLLNLTDHFLLPGYAGYPGTAAASLSPTNADVADMAHAQGGLVGYAHPFETFADPMKDARELPVDVALGKIDYLEVVGFSDHKLTSEIWYQLLNCGFHLPAAGGTDAMANFASLRGPVGLNRVYAKVPKGTFDIHNWLNSLKQGRTFATNGPLLGFTLEGREAGDTLQLPHGNQQVKFTAWLRSIVPVDHLEVMCNGHVVAKLPLNADHRSADVSDTIPISQSGWCLLRAFSDHAEEPIMDNYPYATTSPVYMDAESSRQNASEDAAYFVRWIDRLTGEVKSSTDWNTQGEKQSVLDQLSRARAVYTDMGSSN